MNKAIVSRLHICCLPGWRSVWEKTVALVLSTASTDRPSPVNNLSLLIAIEVQGFFSRQSFLLLSLRSNFRNPAI